MSTYRLSLINSIRSWGGAELWFLETARELRARGLEVDLVAQPGSELLRRARAAGVPCAAIPIRFDAAPWTLWKLARHFRSRGTTVAIANLTKDLKAAAVAGRMAGVERVYATRESDFPLKNSLHYRWYLGRLASGVLVNSAATLKTTLDSAPWLERSRVHLLYKGIDTERFHPRPGGPDRDRVVGFVGQLIERKGLPTLMAAWSELEKNGDPGARLRIAGSGPLAAGLRDWHAGLSFPGRVELCGHLEKIEDFYAACGMLVLPSRSEGFGLAAAEAAACGLPVIASRASSLPEIIEHEKNGLLVEPRQPRALAAAIARLLDDGELARRLGRNGAIRIRDRFDREHTLRELLRLTGGPALPPTASNREERPT